MRLRGKRVVVIGGSSGIGLAAARMAAAEGAAVVIASRSTEKLATAAASIPAQVETIAVDIREARQAFDSKFWGQYMAAKHGAPMIRSGGSITLVSGSNSQRPLPQAAVRAAINSAVEGLARALAVELMPIRVNAVAPGLVDTPLHDRLPQERKDALFQAVAASLPLKRVGTAEEIAEAILHLMANGYTTGSTLFVDGGYTLR
jgi:NAD(P)-dependent dehydrogenase (short-subunit alcohol dehydrogenase family)